MAVRIIDSTLREGRQSQFCDKILQLQIDHLQLMQKIGIVDVEYRNPSTGKDEIRKYKQLVDMFPDIHFYVHIFLNRKNIDWVINEPSVKKVSTFVTLPLNEKTREELFFLFKRCNKTIRIGIENASSTSIVYIQNFVRKLVKEKFVKRIGFSDTLGLFTSESIEQFLDSITSFDFSGKDIEFHLHNDYGLAASNACKVLSQLEKFDSDIYLSASMLGIGDRNGILSIGDVFANLIRLKIPHDLNMKKYGTLVELFEKRDINFSRDPVSSGSFSHFASSHILGEMKNRGYTSLDPETFGMTPLYIFNRLTDTKVYNEIAKTITNMPTLADGLLLKKYVLKRMKQRRLKFVYLDDVVKMLKTYASIKTSRRKH